MDNMEETPNLSGEVEILSYRPAYSGSYSTVYRGKLKSDGQLVGIKVLNTIHGVPLHSIQRKIERERRTWSALRHPNILPMYGFADDDEHFQPFGAFISPWYERGDLADYIREHGSSAPLEERALLWRDVVSGVMYLHLYTPVLIHGDLKPRNVLIDNRGIARLCDFGLVRIYLEEGNTGMTTTSAYTGTERYLAYELVTAQEDAIPTTETDIYATGCIGLEVLFLQIPYSNRGTNLRFHMFTDMQAGIPPATTPDDLDPELSAWWEAVSWCWARDPLSRPHAQALYEHLEYLLWASFRRPVTDVYTGRQSIASAGGSSLTATSTGVNTLVEHPPTHDFGDVVLKSMAAVTLSDEEHKRQDAINEILSTETEFFRAMESLQDVWISTIRRSNAIPPDRREKFIKQVFWNLSAVMEGSTRLQRMLLERQNQQSVIGEIGDIFKSTLPFLESLVEYGAHRIYSRYELEMEKRDNPAFARILEEVGNRSESQLELNSLLAKPTTRIARYPLFLEAVLKHTPASSADKGALKDVIQSLREMLTRMNQKSGESEDRIHLYQLERQLQFKQGEYIDLKLTSDGRKLIYEGSLVTRGWTGAKEEILVFLFDHALLLVRPVKIDQYKVLRKPIPLELLRLSTIEEPASNNLVRTGGKPSGIKPKVDSPYTRSHSGTGHASTDSMAWPLPAASKNGFPLTFTYLGRTGYSITLWTSTMFTQKKWLDNIQAQYKVINELNKAFEMTPVLGNPPPPENKIDCAVLFANDQRMAYGTRSGVFMADLRQPTKVGVRVATLPDVTHIEILESSNIMLVLTAKELVAFPLKETDFLDLSAIQKRGKRISTQISFFKSGFCLGRPLVCAAKISAVASTFKIFEPIASQPSGQRKTTIRKLLQGGGDDLLKLYKEFYMPAEAYSITFLRVRICLGCSTGFQIVDVDSLDTQSLLDPSDPNSALIDKKSNPRPISVFRVDRLYLLCYDECAFWTDNRGLRARLDIKITWEGRPTAFALRYPYIIAIEPMFIEIWDIESGTFKEIIPGDNIEFFFADSQMSDRPIILGNGANAVFLKPVA